jgi:DNA-binding transcriptional LysR family regulator
MGTKGVLRVSYTTITGHSLVPDISLEFRNENPEIKLDLSYHSSPAQRDLIIRDEIDIGFLVGSFKSSEIETRLVATHPVIALLPPEHPLCKKAELTVADLVRESLILGTDAEWPTFRRVLVDMFQKEGHIIHVAQEATSLLGILGLVTAGMGITLFCGLPRFCGSEALVSRPIRTKSPVIVETHVAWKRSNTGRILHRFVETSQAIGGRQLWN